MRKVPFRKWIFTALVKQALVPVVVVESALLIICFLGIYYVKTNNTQYLQKLSKENLAALTADMSGRLNEQLLHAETLLDIFIEQTNHTLENPNFVPNQQEVARRREFNSGAFGTFWDNGGAAAFYSAATPRELRDVERSLRMAEVDHVMKSIVDGNSLINQIYLNTRDNYTHIYPYFDTNEQFVADIELAQFNFFYLADEKHNPSGNRVWTPVYLDPAGLGWMISIVKPLRTDEKPIQEVAGADITLDELFDYLTKKELPWSASLYILNEQNEIIFSVLGDDTNLRTVRGDYTQVEHQNEQKVEHIADSQLLQPIRQHLETSAGQLSINIDGSENLYTWRPIPSVDWRLVTVLDDELLLASVDQIDAQMNKVMYILVISLAAFYLIFFFVIRRQVRNKSILLSSALAKLDAHGEKLAREEYAELNLSTGVQEIDNSVRLSNLLGERLKRKNQTIREHERFMSYALEASGDIVFRLDLVELQVQLGATLRQLFGATQNEKVPVAALKKLMDASEFAKFREELLSHRSSQDPFNYELAVTIKAARRWLWIKGAFIDPNTFTGTAVDITQQVELQAQLEHAKNEAEIIANAKSKLLSSLSHELRTPLTTLVGYTQLLRETELSELQFDLVGQLELASGHLNNIVEDVLKTVKLETRTLEFNLKSVDLSLIVEDAINVVEPLMVLKDIKCRRVNQMYQSVLADSDQLYGALVSLFSQAVNLNRAGTNLTVLTLASENEVQLVIRDDGDGAFQEEVRAILATTHNPSERSVHVMNIGLRLSLELLIHMNGKVEAEIDNVNGTKVTISLPRGNNAS